MHLQVITPAETVLDSTITKLTFDSIIGRWTVLPRHQDFVTVVPTGIVYYEEENGAQRYVAIVEGTLVKKERDVTLSTGLAIVSDHPERLVQAIEQDFKKMEEDRKTFNATVARLEVGLARGLMTLKEQGEGL